MDQAWKAAADVVSGSPLPDACAVGDRLAWKYALSLELCDAGFDHSVLAEFRSRLIEGHAEQRLLDLLLERCREGGWLKAGGRQRTDSTHVLASIRALNRTLCVAQTMVYVLNVLSYQPAFSGTTLTCLVLICDRLSIFEN